MRSFQLHLLAVPLLAALALHGCSCGDTKVEPPDPLPEEKVLEIRPAEVTLAQGEAVALQAFLDEEDVSLQVAWTTSGPDVDVDAGVVVGRAEGAATITATLEDRFATATVTVTSARLVSLAVSPDSAQTPVGATQLFTASGTFTDGQTRPLQAGITWTSSAPEVATISSGGEAVGASEGTTQITASMGEVQSPAATLTVTATVVTQVAVTPASLSLPLGAEGALTATATWSDGRQTDETAGAEWVSANASVATVTAGAVTATGMGATGVTARVGGVTSAPSTINVTEAVIASIVLSPAQASAPVGQTAEFTATATFTDGAQQDITTTAAWSSSDPAVAQVMNGVALGVSPGSASITASRDGVLASAATFTVTPAVITAIEVTPSSAQVPEGGSQPFVATATWSDGQTSDISAGATWLTSDSTVATIVGGVATGHAVGVAQFTASQAGVTSAPVSLTVTPAVLVSISLSPRGRLLLVGDTQQFVATGLRSDGTTVDVTSVATWSSDDGAVAQVSAGLVTAAGAGTTLVTASTGGVTSPGGTVVVSTTPLQSIAVTPASASIPKGTTQAFTATGTFTDGATAVLTAVVGWSSSAAAIASIDDVGVATGNQTGSADIAAEVNGITSPPAVLTVTPAEITAVAVTPTSAQVAKGRAQAFVATATYTDGTQGPVTTQATWASDDVTVATLDSSGVATAVGEGAAQVTATAGGFTSPPATLTVTPAELDLIVVSPGSASIALGQSQAFTATGHYSDASTQDFTSVASWTSSAPAVASISGPGTAQGAGEGSANIIAQHLGVTSNAAVLQVTAAVIESIALSPATVSLPAGRTSQLTATATWSDGATTNVTATAAWASDAPAATVSGGQVFAAAQGTANITATQAGVTSSTTVVTVTPAVVDSVAVSPAAASIPSGGTQAFTAQATWSDGSTTNVTSSATWTALNTSVATMSGNVATGASTGTSGIIATSNGVTSPAATLSVTQAVVSSISVTPTSLSLARGRTAQLTAIATLTDGSTTDITSSATWSSTSANASVNDGLVTAVDVGTAQLTATAQGVTSNPVAVTVTPAVVETVTVTPASASVAHGRTQAFTASATYSDGTTQSVTSTATWASGDPAVATVKASGVASTHSQGTAGITATFSGVTSSPATLTVTPAVLDLVVVAPSTASIPRGRTQAFTATGHYSDGSTQDLTAVATWTSSAPTVASISAPGSAFGANVGSANITAAHQSVTSSPASLQVTSAVIDSIALSPATVSMPVGRTAQLTATATWSDGTTTDVTGTATWASSGAAATVNAGLVTAAAQGTANVTGTQGGVTSSPTVVTVTPAVVDSVAVSPAAASIPRGRTQAFTAQATWSDGTTTNVTSTATWTALDTSVATMSGNVATGANTGTSGITATFNGVTSPAGTLTVTPAVVDSISVAPTSLSLPRGRTSQLNATATWSDGTTSNINSVAAWASTSANATVSAGLVTAANEGSAQITATHQGVTSNAVAVTVTPAVVDTVALSPSSASVAKGRTQGFTASATYSDGTTQSVTSTATWASGNTAVATVNASGVASTHAQGTVDITATFSGVTSSPAVLTVTSAELDAITLSPLNAEVAVGFSRQIGATGHWSDGAITDVTQVVSWSSAAPAVATVSSSGLVTGQSPGSTQITASASNGISASTQVTVSSATLSSVTVTPNTSRIPAGGITQPLRATGFFSDGSSQDLTEVATWTSADTAVATVGNTAGNKGVVVSGSPAAETSVSITATVGAQSGVAVVTVVPLTLNTISVTPTNSTLPAGYEQSFVATGTYSDGNSYNLTSTVAWSSSSTAVATISSSNPTFGVAQALSAGATTITAQLGAKSGSTTLNVSAANLVSLSLTPATATRAVNLTLQYSVVGVFSDGSTVDVTDSAAWSSSNPSVATVSAAAGSEGLATIVSTGTTTITAGFGGLTAQASLTGSSPTLTGIVVTPAGVTIGTAGFVQMYATATYADGTTADVTDQATWTSNNAAVATVRSTDPNRGRVTGVGPGTATIVATFGIYSGSRNVTVSSATLTEMYVTPALPRIGLGTTVQFRASGVWSDGTTADLTEVANWVTSAPSVATLSNASGTRGLATGVGGGTTTITATYGTVSDATSLTVTTSPMTAIIVTPANRSIPLGGQVQYTATAQYADGTLQDLTTQVGWLTSNSAVASISNTAGSRGLATGVGGGNATISAQYGSLTGSTNLQVRNVTLTSLSLTPAGALIPLGFFRQYSLVGTFSDGTTENLTAQASWTTGNGAIVVASGTATPGRITGVGEGSSTVTASVFGQPATTTVQVVNWQLCSIAVTPIDQTLKVGNSMQMVATGTFGPACPPSPPNVLTMEVTRQVTWRVTPKQRITVSNSPGTEGVATAVSVGSPSFGNVRAERLVNGVLINGSTKVYAVE
jgi:uncharacterized protein YjdB